MAARLASVAMTQAKDPGWPRDLCSERPAVMCLSRERGGWGGPAAASATAATTISVLVAWERRRESRARAGGGAATGGSAVGRRWRI